MKVGNCSHQASRLDGEREETHILQGTKVVAFAHIEAKSRCSHLFKRFR